MWLTKKNKENPQDPRRIYQNLTLYSLEIPKVIYSEAKKRHNSSYQKNFERALQKFHGDEEQAHLFLCNAWNWDSETFIPEDLLRYVKIAGRKTLHARAFMGKYPESPKKELSIKDIAKQIASQNPAAKLYLALEERLNTIAFSKIPKEKYERDVTRELLGTNSLQKLFFNFWNETPQPELRPSDKPEFQRILTSLQKLRETINSWKEKRERALGNLDREKRFEENIQEWRSKLLKRKFTPSLF